MVITVNAGGRSGKVKSRVGQHYYNVVAHKRHSYLDSIDRCLVDCSCGVPEVKEFPCDHAVGFCISAGIDIQDLLHPRDSVSRWKSQYALCTPDELPATNGLLSSPIAFPTQAPRRAGRPTKKRRIGWHEKMRIVQRRNYSCSRNCNARHQAGGLNCPMLG